MEPREANSSGRTSITSKRARDSDHDVIGTVVVPDSLALHLCQWH